MMGMFFTLRSELHGLKKENGRIRKILFGDRGKLNLIDCATCEQHRALLETSLDRYSNALQMISGEVKDINKNVITIMVSQNIKSPTE
jgi:hypothetical protein